MGRPAAGAGGRGRVGGLSLAAPFLAAGAAGDGVGRGGGRGRGARPRRGAAARRPPGGPRRVAVTGGDVGGPGCGPGGLAAARSLAEEGRTVTVVLELDGDPHLLTGPARRGSSPMRPCGAARRGVGPGWRPRCCCSRRRGVAGTAPRAAAARRGSASRSPDRGRRRRGAVGPRPAGAGREPDGWQAPPERLRDGLADARRAGARPAARRAAAGPGGRRHPAAWTRCSTRTSGGPGSRTSPPCPARTSRSSSPRCCGRCAAGRSTGGCRRSSAALALVCFVVLARPEPSVVRAAAMGAVTLLALASGPPAGGGPGTGRRRSACCSCSTRASPATPASRSRSPPPPRSSCWRPAGPGGCASAAGPRSSPMRSR